jgi:hypothetical protein
VWWLGTDDTISLGLTRTASVRSEYFGVMAPEMNWKQQVLTCWLKHQKTLPERYRLSLPTKSVERHVWTKTSWSRRYALPEPHVNALEGIPVDAVYESVVGTNAKCCDVRYISAIE